MTYFRLLATTSAAALLAALMSVAPASGNGTSIEFSVTNPVVNPSETHFPFALATAVDSSGQEVPGVDGMGTWEVEEIVSGNPQAISAFSASVGRLRLIPGEPLTKNSYDLRVTATENGVTYQNTITVTISDGVLPLTRSTSAGSVA